MWSVANIIIQSESIDCTAGIPGIALQFFFWQFSGPYISLHIPTTFLRNLQKWRNLWFNPMLRQEKIFSLQLFIPFLTPTCSRPAFFFTTFVACDSHLEQYDWCTCERGHLPGDVSGVLQVFIWSILETECHVQMAHFHSVLPLSGLGVTLKMMRHAFEMTCFWVRLRKWGCVLRCLFWYVLVVLLLHVVLFSSMHHAASFVGPLAPYFHGKKIARPQSCLNEFPAPVSILEYRKLLLEISKNHPYAHPHCYFRYHFSITTAHHV